MSWLENHRQSEDAATVAHALLHSGSSSEAKEYFARAATAEIAALKEVDVESKPRTFGVTAVSAASLLYKAGNAFAAQTLAHSVLAQSGVPEFAVSQLRELLQTIWNEEALSETNLQFVPGQVTVAVDGGEIVKGGAPLDLVVERVQTIQAIFYRTVEFLRKLPLRTRGAASREIQEICRPWLFQSVPGSYQFTVAIQSPSQGDLFGANDPAPDAVARTFMSILEGAASDPTGALAQVVPQPDYRKTFLKLARNLAPNGKQFSKLEVKSTESQRAVLLTSDSRKVIAQTIREEASKHPSDAAVAELEKLVGVLRALHLENDWLELNDGNSSIKISGVGETMDDVIGPMVNRAVVVHVQRTAKGDFRFIDIEPDDEPTNA